MRWLINYLKSCFCAHDWEMIFNVNVKDDCGSTWSVKRYRCKKCGYSKKYKSN